MAGIAIIVASLPLFNGKQLLLQFQAILLFSVLKYKFSQFASRTAMANLQRNSSQTCIWTHPTQQFDNKSHNCGLTASDGTGPHPWKHDFKVFAFSKWFFLLIFTLRTSENLKKKYSSLQCPSKLPTKRLLQLCNASWEMLWKAT